MKQLIIILLSTIIFGCRPEINNQILANKYTEGFYRTKSSIANNSDSNKDELLLPLIDTIIKQTQTQEISKKLRKTIIDAIGKMPSPKFEAELNRLNDLKSDTNKFKGGQGPFLEDLDFIDRFLNEKYWQNWTCNMGIHQTETLISMDTIILEANRDYELPIRIEYNGLPSNVSIISNSIQGSKPNTIKFKTQSESQKYQTIKYTCQAINVTTGETIKYTDEIVVQIVKNN